MKALAVFVSMAWLLPAAGAGLVARVTPMAAPEARGIEPTRSLAAVPANGPVAVDGVLDEPCWRAGKWIEGFYEAKAAVPARYPMQAKIAFDRTHLYFAFRCPEDKLDTLRLLRTERDDPRVWNDDCVEMFMDANRDGETMFQFMINAAGVVADKGVRWYPMPDPAAGVPGVYVYHSESDWAWNADVRTGVSEGEREWRLEVSMPARDLGLGEIIPGSAIGLTLCRERYAGPQCTGLASLRPNAWGGDVKTYPEVRLGEPLVEAQCLLPAGVGGNECQLTLVNKTGRHERADVELVAKSDATGRASKRVDLPPNKPTLVVIPYDLHGERHDVRVRGRSADGRAFLDRRAAGATEPALGMKIVEHARFVGQPVARVRLALNIGSRSHKRSRLALCVKDQAGRVVGREAIASPIAQGQVEVALRTAAIGSEGLYTIECALMQAGKAVAKASGLLELVAPPNYGLLHEESKP